MVRQKTYKHARERLLPASLSLFPDAAVDEMRAGYVFVAGLAKKSNPTTADSLLFLLEDAMWFVVGSDRLRIRSFVANSKNRNNPPPNNKNSVAHLQCGVQHGQLNLAAPLLGVEDPQRVLVWGLALQDLESKGEKGRNVFVSVRVLCVCACVFLCVRVFCA